MASKEIELKLYNPHHHQKQIHKACISGKEQFVIVCAGRQSGKTLCAENQAIYWAFTHKNMVIGWVSPTDAQCAKVQNEFIQMLGHTNLILTTNRGLTGRKIKFINNSEIRFFSARSENSVRGNSFEFLILDEAAFIAKDTFDLILLPTLAVRGKKLLFVSTPKGKNYFYNMYCLGNQPNTNYKSFKFISADNPLANRQLIEEARKSISDAYFRQEYMAEFVDKASVFGGISDVCVSVRQSPQSSTSYFMGVDVGMKNDYSVISVIDINGKQVELWRATSIESPEIRKNIIKINNIFKCKNIYVEQNGMGAPIISELVYTDKMQNIKGFNTDNKSKSRVISNLVYAINNNEIALINDEQLINEFESFVMEQSDGGQIKYKAENGMHDDIVMATAISYECLIQNRFSGSFSVL